MLFSHSKLLNSQVKMFGTRLGDVYKSQELVGNKQKR